MSKMKPKIEVRTGNSGSQNSNRVEVIIETPKGSRNKLKYDQANRMFKLSKVMPEGMIFPYDFGFVPATKAEDGDPLDVLVLMDEPVPIGTVVPSRLIGVIEAVQTEKDGEEEENHRIIAVSEACELFAQVRKLADLPDAVTAQIEHFFISYNEQAGKKFEPTARSGRKRAEKILEQGRRRRGRRSRKKARS